MVDEDDEGTLSQNGYSLSLFLGLGRLSATAKTQRLRYVRVSTIGSVPVEDTSCGLSHPGTPLSRYVYTSATHCPRWSQHE